MSRRSIESWQEANQSYLARRLKTTRGQLGQLVDPSRFSADEPPPSDVKQGQNHALDYISTRLGLTEFEEEILLLCAGVELDTAIATLCRRANGDEAGNRATFGLALAVLPEAHWTALMPSSPLRRFHLVEVENSDSLVTSPLRIDEAILHFIVGAGYFDERLDGVITPASEGSVLLPSFQKVAESVARLWSEAATEQQNPAIGLCDGSFGDRLAIAEAACNLLGLKGFRLRGHRIPPDVTERVKFLRLCERQAALCNGCLIVEYDRTGADDRSEEVLRELVDCIDAPLIVLTPVRIASGRRPVIELDLPIPKHAETRELWAKRLSEKAVNANGLIEQLSVQFRMSDGEIQDAFREARALGGDGLPGSSTDVLWDSCRRRSRKNLDALAQRLEPAATFEDLVLPESQRQMLREITAHVRQRFRVYEAWGFAAKGSRGLGISALFAGASGTGKTMAAEVLANELRLDLYRIDLSQVVSKYIGETEKNLRKVFEAAEGGGAILLFDEADALFGKRSEVKDSHDRYANIEVSYLLQQMEAYRGLAILTTNNRNALDAAFLRRIRFVIPFPFPDPAHREEIWKRVFPAATPCESLDYPRLARLSVPGGNIRNIALNAAFLAADSDTSVSMRHVLRATRAEYGKLEKTLTESEVAGWI